MKEIWKDIKGYEGMYQVSNLGRVKSLDRVGVDGKKYKGRERKVIVGKVGYKVVDLYIGGKRETKSIHRLIAESFIPNTNDNPEVNHIDHDKLNNSIENLEWVTRRENFNAAIKYGQLDHKLTPVVQIDVESGMVINRFKSIQSASRHSSKFGVGNIWSCCNGTRKTHAGYKWEYA